MATGAVGTASGVPGELSWIHGVGFSKGKVTVAGTSDHLPTIEGWWEVVSLPIIISAKLATASRMNTRFLSSACNLSVTLNPSCYLTTSCLNSLPNVLLFKKPEGFGANEVSLKQHVNRKTQPSTIKCGELGTP